MHAEGSHAPEVVRSTEQRKIMRHTGATAYAGSPTAVPPLHQVGNLALDLGSGSSDSALSTMDPAVGFLIAEALPPGDARESCDHLSRCGVGRCGWGSASTFAARTQLCAEFLVDDPE